MGKYFKFWATDENADWLDAQPNKGGSINQALEMMRKPPIVMKGDTCPNGHLRVDLEHCMTKGCEYAK